MMSLDESANGQQVALTMGAQMVVDLAENPTAGYRWQVESSGAPALSIDGDRYEAPAPGRAGAPGRHSWSFRAIAPGHGTIRLAYRRSFGGAASTFSVQVEVAPPG